MRQKKQKNSPIQESLRLMNQCPVCKQKYEPDERNILKEKAGTHLVHITCPSCSSSVLALIMATQVGLSSVGLVTDLNANDVMRLYRKNSISEDELLGFHQLLKQNKLKPLLN